MNDILLDTNLLADFLAVYFSPKFHSTGKFVPYGNLTKERVKAINHIIRSNVDEIEGGLIVASSFAFVELARQFDLISQQRFDVIQLRAFIEQHPSWFLISALDESLLEHLINLPTSVRIPDGTTRNVELPDALHVATALSRDNCVIAATDQVIKAMNSSYIRVV
jgi:predicted nucleic acid-binding protein